MTVMDSESGAATLTDANGKPVAVSPLLTEGFLASYTTNADLEELKRFRVNSTTGAHLSVDVVGFIRLENRGRFGSIVQLFTPLGA